MEANEIPTQLLLGFIFDELSECETSQFELVLLENEDLFELMTELMLLTCQQQFSKTELEEFLKGVEKGDLV